MNIEEEITKIARDFEKCQKILIALGDSNRQHLILEMLKMKDCNGARVNDIAKCTHLSRPAVSHHLQILKQAGIIKMRKEGTKNFYYFDPDKDKVELLRSVLKRTLIITSNLPDRSGKTD